MTAQEYLRKPYARIVTPDETGAYYSEILEFPGCYAEGKDQEQALRNLESAAESWVEACLEQGQTIPEPFTSAGFAGKIALRLPKSLHRQVARMAQVDGVSINQFLVSSISYRIGAQDIFRYFQHSFAAVNVTHLHISNLSLRIGSSNELLLSAKQMSNETASTSEGVADAGT